MRTVLLTVAQHFPPLRLAHVNGFGYICGMKQMKEVDVIAVDADDTLWDCQTHFDEVERRYCEMLSPYGNADEISDAFFKVETANMSELGYGTKAFVISLLENAINISNRQVTADEMERIIHMGRALMHLPATPLPGVTETLQQLRHKSNRKMVLFTKGDRIEQERKVERSGLGTFFDDVVVVDEKHPAAYERLCRQHQVQPERLAMVGNSFKSDIAPALEVGCMAVHIPFHATWKYEQTETFPHERLITLQRFNELTRLFC